MASPTKNLTKNQHYVSQVEQKLNAIDPSVAREKRQIHKFSIEQRDPPILSLPGPGVFIEHTLSGCDLFSFDVIDARHRENLESQFQKYEQRVADHSRALLRKLGSGSSDIKEELVEVFAAKLLNMFRNPYSVTKILNTVGELKIEPTDSTLNALIQKVASGSQPQRADVCATYGLTPETYEHWLRALFMLLVPRGELNLFEDMIVGLFNKKSVTVLVSEYNDLDPRNICLLSDRGVAFVSDKEDEVQIAFNICSRAFAIYGFTDPGKRAPNLPRVRTDELRGKATVAIRSNDVDALVAFNKHTIGYAAAHVFAAGPDPRLVL